MIERGVVESFQAKNDQKNHSFFKKKETNKEKIERI